MNFSSRSEKLYEVTIFLSAFLLFQIQPMAGKFLLPLFGGTAAVWTTSLFFFSGVLFLGYLYVFLLSRHAPRTQLFVHATMLGIGACLVAGMLLFAHSLHVPFESLVFNATPSLSVLRALAFSVGFPYLLLSTTGPLLQQWYGVTHDSEPYKLYAISNAGSLLALVSYPFFVEPFTTLTHQQFVWGALFIVFSGLCAGIGRRFMRVSIEMGINNAHERLETSIYQKCIWIFLSALPSFVLVAATAHLTRLIAPIPLLWILPLSIYLGTFILAFSGLRTPFISYLLLLSAIATYWFLDASPYDVVYIAACDVALLACVGIFSNETLYQLRPGKSASALFYVYVAFGGMLGTFLASILAPLIFVDYWEFPIALALSAVVALYGIFSSITYIPARISYSATFVSALLVLVPLAHYIGNHNSGYTSVARNFYGTAKIIDLDTVRLLMNGATLHGLQSSLPAFKHIPVSYYTPESGIGRAFMFERLTRPKYLLSVSAIGLGAGMLATYCVPGDTFVFSEIDPKIVTIAKSYFTYLENCNDARVNVGDGRKLLEGDTNQYDLLVVDAFSDDSIPVHLLTREALSLYISHMRGPESIIAIHISNRYFDLLPEILGLAASEKLSVLYVETRSREFVPVSSSRWVLLSKDEKTFSAKIFAGAESPFTGKKTEAWSDDYSNIVSAIRLPVPTSLWSWHPSMWH